MRAFRAALALTVSTLAIEAEAQPGCPPRRCVVVFVGTQGSGPGQGIVAATLDTKAGKLIAIGLAAEVERPTWVVTHPRLPTLTAVSETGNDGRTTGRVISYRFGPTAGNLVEASNVTSGGGGPTHLAVEPRAGSVFVANYGTGQVAAVTVDGDGSLGGSPSVQSDQGSGPSPRQKGPHAHGVALAPGGRHLLVADLGADRLFIYPYDRSARTLAAGDFVALPPGTGPRHLAFHPDGRFLYLISELKPEIRGYRWDAQHGRPSEIQMLPLASDPANDKARGAEIAVSPDGRFVYASIRGEDAVVAYAVNARTGELSETSRIAAGGQTPWSFSLSPDARWMLVANQGSGTVVLFARDRKSGKLTPTGQSIAVVKPTSIAFKQ